MSARSLFVVRRCDGFYRFWHDITDPVTMQQAQAVYHRLTCSDTRNNSPDGAEYYEIFVASPMPGWRDGYPPIVRRLYQQDAQAIEDHLLRLDNHDRRLPGSQ